ncbi:MAG: hypothetical protein IAE78_05580 [Myxococcus sp.]|nr:hypothetical protein [Myxococcus sp.]
MALSFIETMRGAVTDANGREHPLAFHVRTQQLNGGHFALEGVVHASGFGDEAPCEGTLDLSLAPPALRYRVRWSAGGDDLVLSGAKAPSLLAPVKSMTVLPVTLARASGGRLASGTLRFDLFDLPAFLKSWLPVPTRGRRRFEARHVAVSRRALVGAAR